MIKKITLKNFRRYVNQSITFDPQLTYIMGENNAGKTTIFMAIEYALFGRVTGFSSQAELAHPNSDKMGVQLEYIGKDGLTYVLQRMHEVVETSGRLKAKGNYTLKKFEDDEEVYLSSSDFPKDSEEVLQLKIFESLGISKRLFELAINIKQGEITSILEGSPNLDIVLGVSAASLAEKQLRALAKLYEKEITQLKTLQASQKGFEDEKKSLLKQSKHYNNREEEQFFLESHFYHYF